MQDLDLGAIGLITVPSQAGFRELVLFDDYGLTAIFLDGEVGDPSPGVISTENVFDSITVSGEIGILCHKVTG